MTDLKNIFMPEEYKEMGRRLERRIAKIEEAKKKAEESRKNGLQEKEEREKVEKERRMAIMNYLQEIYSDKLCQNYLKIFGELFVYKFFVGPKLYFRPTGIYLDKLSLGSDGQASRKVDCGMGGSYYEKYNLEDLVSDIEEFKTKISDNIHKQFKNAKI